MKKIFFALSCFLGIALAGTETKAYTHLGFAYISSSSLYCTGLNARCFTDFNSTIPYFIPGNVYYIEGYGNYRIYSATSTPTGPSFPVTIMED